MMVVICVYVKVKLYLTSPDDQHSQNNTSPSLSPGMLTVGGAAGVNAAGPHSSDYEDDTTDPEEDLSETDDDDDLWTCVSAVLQQSHV